MEDSHRHLPELLCCVLDEIIELFSRSYHSLLQSATLAARPTPSTAIPGRCDVAVNIDGIAPQGKTDVEVESRKGGQTGLEAYTCATSF